jgi:putative transposase
VFGSICRVLSAHGTKIAPSTYYAAKSCPASPRAVRDEWLKTEITRIFEANFRVYGAQKLAAIAARGPLGGALHG